MKRPHVRLLGPGVFAVSGSWMYAGTGRGKQRSGQRLCEMIVCETARQRGKRQGAPLSGRVSGAHENDSRPILPLPGQTWLECWHQISEQSFEPQPETVYTGQRSGQRRLGDRRRLGTNGVVVASVPWGVRCGSCGMHGNGVWGIGLLARL